MRFIDMIKETAAVCSRADCRKAGILATEGTIKTGLYSKALLEYGIEPVILSGESQKIVNDIIYSYIKAGVMPEYSMFEQVYADLKNKGANKIILACTELSLLSKHFRLGGDFIDAMEILACRSIEKCGKKPIGFDGILLDQTLPN